MRFANCREHCAYLGYQSISVRCQCQGILELLVEVGDPARDRAASRSKA